MQRGSLTSLHEHDPLGVILHQQSQLANLHAAQAAAGGGPGHMMQLQTQALAAAAAAAVGASNSGFQTNSLSAFDSVPNAWQHLQFFLIFEKLVKFG